MTTYNSRTNPCNGTTNWNAITGELHTIEYHSDKGLYGFYLNEHPQTGSLTIADVSTGAATGATFEVITIGTPASGQIRVDYTNKTGWCWGHSDDDGMLAECDYTGGGWINGEGGITQIIEDILGGTGGQFVTEAEATTIAQTEATTLDKNVVVLRDEKAAGTDGGTFTSGDWRTRDINTIDNPFSLTWVSLASNQITLSAGTYIIEASAPAFAVNEHKTRFRNITDGTTSISGSGQYSDTTDGDGRSVVCGILTITGAKVFELQHRSTVTKATNGFGLGQNWGEVEVYSIVTITKIA